MDTSLEKDLANLVWLLRMAILPVIGWGLYITIALGRLVWQHQNPERTGFGTVGLRTLLGQLETLIENNNRGTKALVHYIKWMTQETTGKVPPPPLDGE